ncbi:TniB family NTP-binding protein [Variovorax sp. YR750]|uniref:TniB family NTP-binding protein n=1 Tax=Variovorax sp. YR750 TaxID=1884384 RepID=UPI001C4302CA|nr:TniB family NTP-binding protein [Variovorax sp. YR750]
MPKKSNSPTVKSSTTNSSTPSPSKPNSSYPHLGKEALKMIDAPDAERQNAILMGSWMSLGPSVKALEFMEFLLRHPPSTRPPNLLLIGDSHSGKSTVLEHFLSLHGPVVSPEAETSVVDVVVITCPPEPKIKALYMSILDALLVPYKPNAEEGAMYSQIKLMFRKVSVKVLLIDEINNTLQGPPLRQRQFRNALKNLAHDTKVRMVTAGTYDALNALTIDEQLGSRFETMYMPRWKSDKEVGTLLATMEKRIPLKKPSDLKSVAMLRLVQDRAEDSLGDICSLVRNAAVKAIDTGDEQITEALINDLVWTPPSKRRRSVQPGVQPAI